MSSLFSLLCIFFFFSFNCMLPTRPPSCRVAALPATPWSTCPLLKIRVRHVFLYCGQIIHKNIWKSVTIRKLCKNAIKCHQAEFCRSIRLDFTAERVKWFTLIYEVKIFFWNSSSCILICPVYTNHKNIGKSVTVVKCFERSFICHQAELICSNCLDFITESVQSPL